MRLALFLIALLVAQGADACPKSGLRNPPPCKEDKAVPEQRTNELATRASDLTEVNFERLGLQIAHCWNVGSLSPEGLAVSVRVGFSLDRSGRPDLASIRLIEASGGSDAAARQAFEAARRAIIRCGSQGYNLPVEKYAQWREIEMTFNPEKMRIR